MRIRRCAEASSSITNSQILAGMRIRRCAEASSSITNSQILAGMRIWKLLVELKSIRIHFAPIRYGWSFHHWRASETAIRGVQIRAGAVRIYIYTYIWRYMKQNSSACHVYVM